MCTGGINAENLFVYERKLIRVDGALASEVAQGRPLIGEGALVSFLTKTYEHKKHFIEQ